jgi:hypothetical protein
MENQSPLTMADATTADDILTVLHGIKPEGWELALLGRTGKAWDRLLRAAADLCGVDSVGMSRRASVRAIAENF